VVLVLEPIFEADLQPEQLAYRPGCSALEAVQVVQRLLNSGHTEVVDADLKGYFDETPHAELMKSVARRISDGRILRLIKMWLQAPVEEIDDRGREHRTTPGSDRGRGRPKGAPISPLLANLSAASGRIPREAFAHASKSRKTLRSGLPRGRTSGEG
jgi:retron-type reverse transcriptase